MCVAVCCSVLQCVAVCCSVLQCVAMCCSVLQYVCNTLEWLYRVKVFVISGVLRLNSTLRLNRADFMAPRMWKETYNYKKRSMHIKRDLFTWNETYTKRDPWMRLLKGPMHIWKKTIEKWPVKETYEKRSMHMKRDVYTWNETNTKKDDIKSDL